MQRGPWIMIGGSIVLAAAILAVALLAMNRGKSAVRVEVRGPSDARMSEAEPVAHDRSAQAALRNALVVAKVYYTARFQSI